MAWSTPPTWTPGELVTAALMQILSDDLTASSRALYHKTAAKQVVSSTAETDLLNGEVTIAAGVMETSRVVRLIAWGDWVNNTGGSVATPRLKLKLGGTTLIDSNVVASGWGTSANRHPWRIVADILNLGATNAQWVSMFLDATDVTGTAGTVFPTTGEGLLAASSSNLTLRSGASAAVDTTAACALALTATLATSSASEDMTLKGALVELV